MSGCTGKPRQGKPFCSEHILRLPYASELANEVKRREEEIRAIELGAPIDPNCMSVQEILGLLSTRSVTIERVTRERGISPAAVEKILLLLESVGQVIIHRTSRGTVIARLRSGPDDYDMEPKRKRRPTL